VLLVKLMNSDPVHVMLPLGTALLLNGYWPLQLVVYAVVWSRTKTPRPLTGKLVGGYLVIGVLAGLVSALRCIGISYMPGSVYVIISTADLPINTLLSRCVLRKKFEPLQYLTVACAMCGIALVMLQKESDADRLKQHCDGDSCIDDWARTSSRRSSPPCSQPQTRCSASSCSRRTKRTRSSAYARSPSSTRSSRFARSASSCWSHTGGPSR
jgi:hypothetical protein